MQKGTVHYDGKLLHELSQYKVKPWKDDHLAIIFQSVNIPHGEQLLGIPPLDGGTGEHQKDAIVELLDMYNVRNHTVALCQNTTAANTGPYKGAFIMLCKELRVALLRVDSRHHIKELHIKHYAGPVTPRGTSSPGDALFKS